MRFGYLRFFAMGVVGIMIPNLDAQDSQDSVFTRKLLIEKTLTEAKTLIEQNDFRKAVNMLERHLGIINGDRTYLEALRLAYSGLVRELEGTEQTFERTTYQRRLSFLDPSQKQDLSKPIAGETPSSTKTTKAWSTKDGTLPEVHVGNIQLEAAQALPLGSNLTARGKLNEKKQETGINPFSWANSQQKHDAETFLQMAESAFARGDFTASDSMYGKAWQTDPMLEQEARERWAYSRLHRISEKSPDKISSTEGIRELEAISAMAPRLKPQVDELKAAVGKNTNTHNQSIDLTHRETNGWVTTASPSFRIHHHLDRSTGEKLARLLENTRATQIERWFGGSQEPWNPPCDVVIHETAAHYSSATGVPSTSPGHSTVKVDGGRVTQRRIDLHADDPNMSVGVLPHEATHIVLAGRFGTHLVPRWADEGMAVLSEPSDRIAKHTNDLPRLGAQTGVFPIRSLMSQHDYPDARMMGTFYAQSVSVVNHMTSLKGPRVFAAFVKDGLDHGYDQALAKHYSMTWDQLEASWRQQGNQQVNALR